MRATTAHQNFEAAARPVVPDHIYVFHHTADQAEIRMDCQRVETPDHKRVLMEDVHITLKEGERAGLTGPNGGGKSSLFRVMAGLESAGKGQIHITLPAGKRMMVVSQQIRQIPTTLPGILAYKGYSDEMADHYTDTYTHEQYERALDDAFIPELKVHLPWNAAKPDNLFPIFADVMDKALYPYIGKVSSTAAYDIAGALMQTLHRKMYLPETIAPHYTPEDHDQLMDQLTLYLAVKLTDPQNSSGEEKKRGIVFPSFTGRKLGRTIIDNANNAIKNWLLQGHKMRLSGGEQQKLGFARLFLQADEVGLFLLDEASSALKGDMADALFTRLFEEKAKGASAIAVIHNNDLLKHFTHHMALNDKKELALIALTHDQPASPDEPQDEAAPQP